MTIYADQWEEMCYAKKAAETSAENEVRQLYGRIAHHIFVSVLVRVVSYRHHILFSLKCQYSYGKLLTFYFLKNF